MSERITEAELQRIKGGASRALAKAPTNQILLDLCVVLAEVRRLRGLITPFAGNNGFCCHCIGCGELHALGEDRHRADCPWTAIETEACAIREEGGR